MNVKNYSSGKARTSNLLIVRLTVRRASQLRHRGLISCCSGVSSVSYEDLRGVGRLDPTFDDPPWVQGRWEVIYETGLWDVTN